MPGVSLRLAIYGEATPPRHPRAASEAHPTAGARDREASFAAWVKDHLEVDLVDLAAFDQRVYCCGSSGAIGVLQQRGAGSGSWTIEHPEIARACQKSTTRAGQRATGCT